jgi:tetratricopeptide (TPR) repeat protein
VRATLSSAEKARLANPRPVNAAAHDAYLRGRAQFATLANTVFTPQSMNAIIAEYERAIQLDPGYAPPYAALSVAYETASQTSLLPPSETFPNAKAMALKAIELDDELSSAHAALAGAYIWHEWDWPAAEREAQRALQLSPDSADALTAWLEYLVIVARRADDAARTSERILSVDPVNPFSRVQTIWTAYFSRRHDDAIRNARTLLELWPMNFMAPFFLASNYAVTNRRAETKTECGKVVAALQGNYNNQVIGTCVWALGIVGETQEARRLLGILEHPTASVWLDPAVMASAYAALGDMDRAIEWCEKGLQEHAPNMVYMNAGAPWDPLRKDPRFQAMFRRMNFPQ